jgi:hypothetical protein
MVVVLPVLVPVAPPLSPPLLLRTALTSRDTVEEVKKVTHEYKKASHGWRAL